MVQCPLFDEGVDYTKEYDDIAYPRNTYDECVDYIAEELVKAATMLDDTRDVQNIVRPTRGAALALRSRVLCMQQALCITDKHRRR